MLPRIFGPYEPIRRDYPIEEYLADIAGTGVEKSVYVQANWAPERAEDEVAWVQKTADETRLAARHRRLRRSDGRGRPPGARPAGELSADARHPHAASLARERAVPLRQAARPRRRSERSGGISRRSPTTASPSTCRSSRARWQGAARLAARFPEDHLHPAARRHAGGSVGGGQGGVARRHAAARRAAERRRQSSPASAPSSTATIRSTSPGSCGETVGAVRRATAASSARTFRSRSCGPTIARCIEAYRAALAPYPERSSAPCCTTPRRGCIGSSEALAREPSPCGRGCRRWRRVRMRVDLRTGIPSSGAPQLLLPWERAAPRSTPSHPSGSS